MQLTMWLGVLFSASESGLSTETRLIASFFLQRFDPFVVPGDRIDTVTGPDIEDIDDRRTGILDEVVLSLGPSLKIADVVRD